MRLLSCAEAYSVFALEPEASTDGAFADSVAGACASFLCAPAESP
jgi:hypothetical protein